MTFDHLPAIVVHADWSASPKKRWLAQAKLNKDNHYFIDSPQPVGELDSFFESLFVQLGASNWSLVGFDFPIGLPIAYARRIRIKDFIDLLPELGAGRWHHFYKVAHTPEQIDLSRPFYPYRPHGAKRQDLLDALGIFSFDDLRRECERGYPGRRSASPLFWTLGGQQIGKAAIIGWRDVLAPARRRFGSLVALWPFEGRLIELAVPGNIVVCEAYPAEYYSHLGISFTRRSGRGPFGKRVQKERKRNSTQLFDWGIQGRVSFSTNLSAEIHDGFGNANDGEDRFDAVIGLLGMLNVIFGQRDEGWPQEKSLRSVEGWILGQVPQQYRAENLD